MPATIASALAASTDEAMTRFHALRLLESSDDQELTRFLAGAGAEHSRIGFANRVLPADDLARTCLRRMESKQ